MLFGITSASVGDENKVEWVTPVIKGYGPINPLPNAALKPDPKETYKIVYDITKGGKHASSSNPSLHNVARALNLFGTVDMPRENLDVAVILHGPATPVALSQEAYKARFGVDNPNNDLIEKLLAAGVKLYVCGQAIADHGYPYQNVRSNIEVVLGALAAEAVLESKGYDLFKL
jgi:intracellular sulfur oxidation DsrE/DsrF family protein